MSLSATLTNKTQLPIAMFLLSITTLTSMTILTGTILSSNAVSADDDTSVVDEINITVPVSCTLSGTGMNTHNVEINNGQYNSAIGETTMKAFCNDNNGFAIYAIGYTNNEDGKNALTNATLGSTHDIVTGTATGPVNNVDTSQWAMKLSTITSPTPTYPIIIAGSTDDTETEQGDPDFTTFQEVPDDYTLVAKRTAGTDIGTNAEGAILKSTYQAYISKTQPAGTYTGQVKYTLVHPHDVTAPVSPVSIEKAYEKNGKQKYNGYYKMQDMSDSICSIVTLYDEASRTQLIDIRDNKTYYVAKLQDDNCWMTQNLDLDLDSTRTYTNEDTDIGWNTSTDSYGTASWTPVRSTYNNNNKTWCQGGTWSGDTYYAYCVSNYTPESYDPGDIYWNGVLSDSDDWHAYSFSCTYDGATFERVCDETKNPITTYTTVSGTPIREYHSGNYYNWTAAIASNNSIGYGVYDEDMDDYTNTQANQSICPSGWTLPIGGEFYSDVAPKSFQNMVEQYGWKINVSYTLSNDKKVWDSPMYFGFFGYWDDYSLNYVGIMPAFWSSTAADAYYVKDFEAFKDGYVYPYGEYGYRSRGLTMRCLAR